MVDSESKGLLVLFAPGKAETFFEIGAKPITIGRSHHNDITLAGGNVSKRHASIRRTDNGWFVADLASTNGTHLGGRPLPPQQPFRWRQGQTLRIGPYEFEFRPDPLNTIPLKADKKSDPSLPLVSCLPRPETLRPENVAIAPIVVTTRSPEPRLRLETDGPVRTVSIGAHQTFQLILRNEGEVTAEVALSSTGMPLTWLTLPYQTVRLQPGHSAILPIALHPPATSLSKPGRHDLTLRANDGAGQPLASISLTVVVRRSPQFQSQNSAPQDASKGFGRLLIKNNDRQAGKFALSLISAADKLDLETAATNVEICKGDKQLINYRLLPNRRPLIGRPETVPFALTVQGPAGKQQHHGVFTIQPFLPLWLLSVTAILVVILLIAGYLVINNWELFNEQIVASVAALFSERLLVGSFFVGVDLQLF